MKIAVNLIKRDRLDTSTSKPMLPSMYLSINQINRNRFPDSLVDWWLTLLVLVRQYDADMKQRFSIWMKWNRVEWWGSNCKLQVSQDQQDMILERKKKIPHFKGQRGFEFQDALRGGVGFCSHHFPGHLKMFAFPTPHLYYISEWKKNPTALCVCSWSRQASLQQRTLSRFASVFRIQKEAGGLLFQQPFASLRPRQVTRDLRLLMKRRNEMKWCTEPTIPPKS